MGYLLFLREGALLAQPFDTRQMKLTGEPLPIAGQVGRDAGYWNEVRGNFSVSDNGLLVYDSSVNRQSKQLVWVDRQGKLIRSLGAAGGYTPPCLSPDEKRVVVDRFNDQTGFVRPLAVRRGRWWGLPIHLRSSHQRLSGLVARWEAHYLAIQSRRAP